MLLLEKMDLFDVKYGLLVANIEKVFDEENQNYLKQSDLLQIEGEQAMNEYIQRLNEHITNIKQSIVMLNMFENDVTPMLDEINRIFNMGIDYKKEWEEYCKCF